MTSTLIDIESMSVHENKALIVSVAGVSFAMLKAGPEIARTVRWRLPLLPQLLMGRLVDRSTQIWWMEQDEAAQRDLVTGDETPLPQFFSELKNFVHETPVWANGSHFDLSNLKQLSLDLGLGDPWKYNQPRDARTIYRETPRFRSAEGHVEHLVPHVALDDCVEHVWKLWEHWSFEETLP